MAKYGDNNRPNKADPKGDYKNSTRTHRVDGPPDAPNNTETVHWTGRQDATVRPRPLSLKLKVENPEIRHD